MDQENARTRKCVEVVRTRILVCARVKECEHIPDFDIGKSGLIDDHIEATRNPNDVCRSASRRVRLVRNDRGPSVVFD